MSVETREWATRESVHELAVDLVRLETQADLSDKLIATKEDLARLETKLVRLLLSIGIPLIVGMVLTLYRLFIP